MTTIDIDAPGLASDILEDLMSFIERPDGDDDEFNNLAQRLFAHQFTHNLPFQRYCRQQGKTIRTVKHWHDIPPTPIDAFKDLALSCVPPDQCERIFMTSGTTRTEVKGRHYHPHLQVYDLSMRAGFARHFMRGRSSMRMGIIFPTEEMMPNSSLAHYLALAKQYFGTPGSDYFIDENGLELDRLAATLSQFEQGDEPYALLGASYSFVHLMDALSARGVSFRLPKGSRLFDTGGFKGRSRELDTDDFYRRMHGAFGVAPDACSNMYGMTELSTQFYDNGNATSPSVKSGPHWIRTRALDPATGKPMPRGERGVLAHTDLANFNSVTTILTEDVGIEVDGGFILLGRAHDAQAKGCSLAMDAFLRAARS